jgi:hypothetical protein
LAELRRLWLAQLRWAALNGAVRLRLTFALHAKVAQRPGLGATRQCSVTFAVHAKVRDLVASTCLGDVAAKFFG